MFSYNLIIIILLTLPVCRAPRPQRNEESGAPPELRDAQRDAGDGSGATHRWAELWGGRVRAERRSRGGRAGSARAAWSLRDELTSQYTRIIIRVHLVCRERREKARGTWREATGQSQRGARPERSGAEALRAAGMGSSPAFISARWKNPRLGLRTARRRGATRSKCSAARKGCRTTGRTRAERECARLGS